MHASRHPYVHVGTLSELHQNNRRLRKRRAYAMCTILAVLLLILAFTALAKLYDMKQNALFMDKNLDNAVNTQNLYRIAMPNETQMLELLDNHNIVVQKRLLMQAIAPEEKEINMHDDEYLMQLEEAFPSTGIFAKTTFIHHYTVLTPAYTVQLYFFNSFHCQDANYLSPGLQHDVATDEPTCLGADQSNFESYCLQMTTVRPRDGSGNKVYSISVNIRKAFWQYCQAIESFGKILKISKSDTVVCSSCPMVGCSCLNNIVYQGKDPNTNETCLGKINIAYACMMIENKVIAIIAVADSKEMIESLRHCNSHGNKDMATTLEQAYLQKARNLNMQSMQHIMTLKTSDKSFENILQLI